MRTFDGAHQTAWQEVKEGGSQEVGIQPTQCMSMLGLRLQFEGIRARLTVSRNAVDFLVRERELEGEWDRDRVIAFPAVRLDPACTVYIKVESEEPCRFRATLVGTPLDALPTADSEDLTAVREAVKTLLRVAEGRGPSFRGR